jgi:hypothetical protein
VLLIAIVGAVVAALTMTSKNTDQSLAERVRKFKQETSHLFEDEEKPVQEKEETAEGSSSIIVEDTTTQEDQQEEEAEPVIIQVGDCLLSKTSGFMIESNTCGTCPQDDSLAGIVNVYDSSRQACVSCEITAESGYMESSKACGSCLDHESYDSTMIYDSKKE